MNDINEAKQKVTSLDLLSTHSQNTLALENGLYGYMEQYFNPDDLQKFKTKLSMAIQIAKNTQKEAWDNMMTNGMLKATMVNSLVQIISYGFVFNHNHLYFSSYGVKNGGKNPSAIFGLQYQAEISILEKNGYKNINTSYVLKSEIPSFVVTSDMLGFEVKSHTLDFIARTKEARDLMKNGEVICGYATFTNNNRRMCFLMENDILKKSYELAQKRNAVNHKWEHKKAIDIAIIHALFRYLVLKDWDSEEYEDSKTPQTSAASHVIRDLLPASEFPDDNILITDPDEGAAEEEFPVDKIKNEIESECQVVSDNEGGEGEIKINK